MACTHKTEQARGYWLDIQRHVPRFVLWDFLFHFKVHLVTPVYKKSRNTSFMPKATTCGLADIGWSGRHRLPGWGACLQHVLSLKPVFVFTKTWKQFQCICLVCQQLIISYIPFSMKLCMTLVFIFLSLLFQINGQNVVKQRCRWGWWPKKSA